MKNSGNEAKKSLKTKNRSRNLHAKLHRLDTEYEEKSRNLRKKSNIPGLQSKAGRVRHCRLQSPCQNSFLLSFRGAAGDEESRTALKIVVRASRPLSRGHLARVRERDAPATAGETPAPRPSTVGRFSWFPGARQRTGMSDCILKSPHFGPEQESSLRSE